VRYDDREVETLAKTIWDSHSHPASAEQREWEALQSWDVLRVLYLEKAMRQLAEKRVEKLEAHLREIRESLLLIRHQLEEEELR
jgi:hypothetical protein